MSYTMTGQEFSALIKNIDSTLDKIQNQISRIYAELRKAISDYPDIVADSAMAVLNRAKDDADRMDSSIRKLMPFAGDIQRLIEVSARFSGQVQGPVTAKAPIFKTDSMQANDLLVDDNWKGLAANAYKVVLPRHYDALKGFGDTAGVASLALKECATAICKFWMGVSGALVAYLAGLAAVGVTGPTVVGAIVSIVGAVAGIYVAVTEGIGAGMSELEGAAAKFRAEANDNSPYGPDGKWPRAGNSLISGTIRS